MHRTVRPLIATLLVAVAIAACSSADSPLTPRLRPEGAKPLAQRINATDSLMSVTDIAYGDTALVLKRAVPLASSLTATATIGAAGGTLRIDDAGLKVDIPAGALSSPLTITVTALAGADVVYEFQPHGTVFAQPVKVQQDLRGTAANGNATLLRSVHGSYYDTALDSAFVDPLHLTMKVKEHQLGYKENASTQLRFYIGHFSGYIVGMSLY